MHRKSLTCEVTVDYNFTRLEPRDQSSYVGISVAVIEPYEQKKQKKKKNQPVERHQSERAHNASFCRHAFSPNLSPTSLDDLTYMRS